MIRHADAEINKRTIPLFLLLVSLLLFSCLGGMPETPIEPQSVPGTPDSPEAANPLPSPPTGLLATGGNGEVKVRWEDAGGGYSYTVYIATQQGVTKINYDRLDGARAAGAVSPFVYKGLTNGKDYYFVVTAANGNGEGPESAEAKAVPVPPSTAIAGGGIHTLALKEAGTVWAWGANLFGQLGDGTDLNHPIPVQVKGLEGMIAISASHYGYHSVALKQDGTVWSWGSNGDGQLGKDTQGRSSTVPIQVEILAQAKAVAAGKNYTLALIDDGTLRSWGNNTYGQLGDGSDIGSNLPLKVPGIEQVTAIAAGRHHSIALKKDGTVWTWGNNDSHQLGLRAPPLDIEPRLPAPVIGINEVISIAAGENHSIALKRDGTVWAWGANGHGQLGDFAATTGIAVPIQVEGLTGIKAIAGGGSHSGALAEDGTVWTWGDNRAGQLGSGDRTSRKTPLRVNGLDAVKAIDGGWAYTIVLQEDGTVWTWGSNGDGQLGDGTASSRTSPVQVHG